MDDDFEKRKAESEALLKERERLQNELKKVDDEIKAMEVKFRILEKESASIRRDKLTSAKSYIANLSPERRRVMRKATYKMLRKVSKERAKLQSTIDFARKVEGSLVDIILKEELRWIAGRTRICAPFGFDEVLLVDGIRGSANPLPEGEDVLWEVVLVPVRGNKPFYKEMYMLDIPHSEAKAIKVLPFTSL